MRQEDKINDDANFCELFEVNGTDPLLNLHNFNSDLASPRHEMFSIVCETEEAEFMPNIDLMQAIPLSHVFSNDEQDWEQNQRTRFPMIEERFKSFEAIGEVLNKIESQDPPVASNTGCNCKKTMCLKLYCTCFATGKNCGVDCSCVDCLNNDSNHPLRQMLLDELKERPQTVKRNSVAGILETHEDPLIGCNCKKTGCTKKYCDCFKYGLICGPSCRCTDCQNSKETDDSKHLTRSPTKLIKKQKKKSISFNNFVDKLKLFHILQRTKSPSEQEPPTNGQ